MLDPRPQTRIMPLALGESASAPRLAHRRSGSPVAAQYEEMGEGAPGATSKALGTYAGTSAQYALDRRRRQPGESPAESMYGRGTRLPLCEAGYYDWKRGMTVEEVVRRWQEGGEKVYDRSMPAMVPVSVLWPLREYTWTRETARDGGEYWDNLKASLHRKGWNPDEPLHLDIGRQGGVKVGEGNHRLAIARAAGVREVPVWFHFITMKVVKNPQHSLARSMPEPPPKPRPAPPSKPLPPDPERDKYVDDIMRLLSPGYRGEAIAEGYYEDDEAVATFSDLDDLKDAIRRKEEFLRQRHKFIRFGRHGAASRIQLPPDLMADIEGGLYDPHTAELGGGPVRYERGVSVYFARKKGDGWEPESPDPSRSSYGLSDYWSKMARFFEATIRAGDVFLVEGSLVRDTERVPIELDYSPEQEYESWMQRWFKKDLPRRKAAGLGVTIPKGSRATWVALARNLGGAREARGWELPATYYFPNEKLHAMMLDLIAKHGPTTRQLPSGVRTAAQKVKVPEPPGAPKVEAIPEELPTYATGSDGEPVVENIKVLSRMDPFGKNPKLPRLYLPFRIKESKMKMPKGVLLHEADVQGRALQRAASMGDLQAAVRLAHHNKRVGKRWTERDIQPGLIVVDLGPEQNTSGGVAILPDKSTGGDVWRVHDVMRPGDRDLTAEPKVSSWRTDRETGEPRRSYPKRKGMTTPGGKFLTVAPPDAMLIPLNHHRVEFVWYRPEDLARALNGSRFSAA